MKTIVGSWMLVIIPLLLVFGAMARADEGADREALRASVEQLQAHGRITVRGVIMTAGDLIAEIYTRRGFFPAWQRIEQVGELAAAIRAMVEEGLAPADYNLVAVQRAHQELASSSSLTPNQRAALDLVLTESLIRMGYHLQFGKVNPQNLNPAWNFGRKLAGKDPVDVIQQAIDSPSLKGFMTERFPRGPLYLAWRGGLEKYRQLAAAGGWPRIDNGPVLKPGVRDVRLTTLARRLAITGGLPESAGEPSEFYDDSLQAGVRRFQARHGLDVDGILGPATLAALNVPVQDRIDQLRVNMERARWVAYGLEEDFIVVNIAGFRVYVVRGGRIVWQTKVQVGSRYHKTPVFRGAMKYVVFNPTWTVPYSIATKEMLPKIKRDPDYFDKRDFEVRDGSGATIDPATVDWSKVTRRNFRYTFVQPGGPNNALGRVKFIFPNRYAVYLHDTPSKALFAKSERAFSHGCIRVENPFSLAEVLLGDQGWNRTRMEALTATKTVHLSKPLAVLLLYWTADVGQDGALRFLNDIYGRDKAIAGALEAPYAFDLPPAG